MYNMCMTTTQDVYTQLELAACAPLWLYSLKQTGGCTTYDVLQIIKALKVSLYILLEETTAT